MILVSNTLDLDYSVNAWVRSVTMDECDCLFLEVYWSWTPVLRSKKLWALVR